MYESVSSEKAPFITESFAYFTYTEPMTIVKQTSRGQHNRINGNIILKILTDNATVSSYHTPYDNICIYQHASQQYKGIFITEF
ncbi:hypothetical protein BLOT_012092 [Blomia tropicalis]|nr:hypothetical protein BLOT_012092 [Blomia tropicalis]